MYSLIFTKEYEHGLHKSTDGHGHIEWLSTGYFQGSHSYAGHFRLMVTVERFRLQVTVRYTLSVKFLRGTLYAKRKCSTFYDICRFYSSALIANTMEK